MPEHIDHATKRIIETAADLLASLTVPEQAPRASYLVPVERVHHLREALKALGVEVRA